MSAWAGWRMNIRGLWESHEFMLQDWEYNHNKAEIEIDHENTDSIVCPYCGYEYGYDQSREMIGITTNAWSFSVICKKCKKLFTVSWDFDQEEEENEEYVSEIFWSYHEEPFL